jgi:hypothetical protein
MLNIQIDILLFDFNFIEWGAWYQKDTHHLHFAHNSLHGGAQ